MFFESRRSLRERIIEKEKNLAGTFFGKGNFIVLEDNLTFEELRRAVQKANKEFYLRPQYILQSMGSIRSLSDVKYYLSGGLEMIKSIL